MDAPHPTCQVALIGKARPYGNLCKAGFSIPNHFDRTLQSQMNDIAVGAHADRPRERTREMKLTALRDFRKRCNVKGLAQVFYNEFFYTLKNVLVQQSIWLSLIPDGVMRGKGLDKTASGLVPKHRTARIPVLAFQCQLTSNIEENLVMATEITNQLRLKRPTFSSGEREFVRPDHYKNGVEVLIRIAAGIQSGGTDYQRSILGFVAKCTTP